MVRLLPLLLMVAMLAFTLRVSEVVTGFRDMSGGAVAEDKVDDKSTDAPVAKPDVPADNKGDKPADAATDAKPKDAKPKAKVDATVNSAKNWPDPSEMDPELAEVRSGLVKDLAERRKNIELQEKSLATREAVLKAAESEIDQKVHEMAELRKQLQGLLDQQSEEEAARIKSLVRIYEGMKPADAARIFNTLDTTILLDVLTRMSERKASPVLAAMDPDRARTMTLLMAQQKKLPDLPEMISPQAGDVAPAASSDASSDSNGNGAETSAPDTVPASAPALPAPTAIPKPAASDSAPPAQ